MKYLKKFENINKEETKNKILILDISPSCISEVLHVLQYVNLYLSENITAILCCDSMNVIPNITLPDIIDKIDKIKFNNNVGGVNILQNGIDYIIKNNIEGRVLIISDGFDYVDLDKLKNKVSFLSTDTEPQMTDKKCQIFLYNFEDTDLIYEPKFDTTKDYEIAKTTKKFNL